MGVVRRPAHAATVGRLSTQGELHANKVAGNRDRTRIIRHVGRRFMHRDEANDPADQDTFSPVASVGRNISAGDKPQKHHNYLQIRYLPTNRQRQRQTTDKQLRGFAEGTGKESRQNRQTKRLAEATRN